jgi:hypothetical protein
MTPAFDQINSAHIVPRALELTADATAVVGTAYGDACAGLNLAVTNGVTIRFQFMLFWVANATTTGARFSLNGPAHTRLTYSVRHNTTATVFPLRDIGTAYDQPFTIGTASDAAENLCLIEGLLLPSASGTLAVRSAAEVISPGSVTVKAGSSVLYW